MWIPVTDHPNHPHAVYEGHYTIRATEAKAQELCDAWNRYSGEWRFYPERVQVRAKPKPGTKMSDDPGPTLF